MSEVRIVDLEKPMHFTKEQSEWIKAYVIVKKQEARAEVIDKVIQAEKNKFFCVEDLCDGTKDCTDCRVEYLEQLKNLDSGKE